MRNLFITVLFFLFFVNSYAQVGIGTTTPDASSILELNSTTQGMLTPRMTESERDLIATPATGLLIYQTDNTPGFYYYNSAAWVPFGGSDSDWTVVGNDMYNANTGNVGVGNTAPTAKFHVTGTASGGSGGTNTILSQDFESSALGFVTAIVSTNEYQTTAAGGTEVWRVVDASTDYVTIKCTSCTGQWIEMEYESVDQDETFVSSQFSPSATATSLDITFDYIYKEFLGSVDESFSAYLYNDTDGAIASTLFSHNNVGDQDLSYSGSFTFSGVNVATDSYTLRFQYTGNNDYGASVDNLVVIENTAVAPGSSVFRLEDGTEQAGYVLTSDANGNATWQVASGGGTDSQTLSISGSDLTISNGNTITLPSGGGGSYTFDNGLTLTGSNVQLGGTLTQNTTIDLDDYDLTFTTGSGAFPGDIIAVGTNRTVLETNLDDNYINFGGGFPSVDADDGATFNDTGNSSYTKDFVAGFYNGTSGGSAIALGSIEYIFDGTSELFLETSALSPMDNLGADLGAGSAFQSGPVRNWDDVYAQDFIATSGTTYNKISNKASYKSRGLNEILKLEPITYREDARNIGSRISSIEERDVRLGFTANNVLKAIPEAVKTSDWITLEEGQDPVKMKVDNPSGIMYNQIIPVTVKAIQEQQDQIEKLKSEISVLKELVNKLISEKE